MTNIDITHDGHHYTARPVLDGPGSVTYAIDGVHIPTTVAIDRVIAADATRLRDALEQVVSRAALRVAA